MKTATACSKVAALVAALIPGEKTPVRVTYDSAEDAFVIYVRDCIAQNVIERGMFRYDVAMFRWADTTDHAETALLSVIRAYPELIVRVAITSLDGMFGMLGARDLLLARLELLDADIALARGAHDSR